MKRQRWLQPSSLPLIAGNPRKGVSEGNLFIWPTGWLELVVWTGRTLRAGKWGPIPANPAKLPPILERLRIDPKFGLYKVCIFMAASKGRLEQSTPSMQLVNGRGKGGHRIFPPVENCRPDTSHHDRFAVRVLGVAPGWRRYRGFSVHSNNTFFVFLPTGFHNSRRRFCH
jgi:hypothetical protein